MSSLLPGRARAASPAWTGCLWVATLLLAGCGGGGGGSDAPPTAGTSALAGSAGSGGAGSVDGSTLVVGGVAPAALVVPTVEDDGSLPGPGSLRYGIDVCECSAASDATSS